MKRFALLAGASATLLALFPALAMAQGVTAERLVNAGSAEEAGNWLTVHKNYDSNRYSSLDQISSANVSGLKLAFAVPLGGLEPAGFGIGGMQTTPLVDNGFMYLTDPWGTPYKIDVSSGTAGKVLVGQSFGDWATRGFIAALNAATGEEVWRFYTVPEPGQPGSDTWKCDEAGNPDCWKTGGGAPWMTGSYDPETNSTIWGTGNPVPMFDPEFRPGDNLYTNSSIGLDMDTGALKWHFQYTPGDYMDYDEVGSQLLVNTQIDGQDRKVLAHFGRNGLFYTLDRTNGSYIASGQYVKQLT